MFNDSDERKGRMDINTCYVCKIQKQLDAVPDKKTGTLTVSRKHPVDDRLMQQTADICLKALKFCTSVILKEWDGIMAVDSKLRKRRIDMLIHKTKKGHPKYPEFDEQFPNLPAYTRRSIIADAFGTVKSYKSNLKNWEELSPVERGAKPTIGFPSRYELTFYDQERKMSHLADGQIGLKLFSGHSWNWYYFQISQSDARYIYRMSRERKMLSPIVYKVRGRYQVRFTFQESRELVQNENKLAYRILAVDLGINAAASWCVMESDGTVHAKGVIHLACEEDRLNHIINRKRMYQQSGKKSRCVYRWITEANRQLSIKTAKALMDTAILYNTDCIVFEHLDSGGKIRGKKYRERIHLWRKNDVQNRLELQAHRHGMRISRICAWGTSKYAFDGSGRVDRYSVYRYEHGRKIYNYSVCTFQTGKVYNCDLSAAQNIGARFFLREYEKSGVEGLPPTPQRTLCTLRLLVSNGLPLAA